MSREIANFSRTYPDGEQQHTHGQRARDHRGFEYIFVKAGSAITAGRTTVVDEEHGSHHVTNANSDRGDRAGVAFVDIPSGHYGWICIYGVGNVRVAANCGANRNIYTTSTAGVLDDTASGQQLITGIYLTTARGGTAGAAPAVWSYPFAN